MQSCLYSGWVEHRRLVPRVHRFRYKIHLHCIDLEDENAFRRRWPLLGLGRLALSTFRPQDHGTSEGKLSQTPRHHKSGTELAGEIRQWIELQGEEAPRGKIFLLTQFRFLGYVFNPVSFYLCHDEQDRLQFVVAEVNNFPWKERHFYLVPSSARHRQTTNTELHQSRSKPFSASKEFHVSPFMSLDMDYRWVVPNPGETLRLSIANIERDKKVFDVVMNLKRVQPSWLKLLRLYATQPFQPQRVVLGIYWQAFRLWLKRIKIHPHPKHRESPQASPTFTGTQNSDMPNRESRSELEKEVVGQHALKTFQLEK